METIVTWGVAIPCSASAPSAPLAQGRAANGPELAGGARKQGASAAPIALARLLDRPGV